MAFPTTRQDEFTSLAFKLTAVTFRPEQADLSKIDSVWLAFLVDVFLRQGHTTEEVGLH
jgi:hypothetical protein